MLRAWLVDDEAHALNILELFLARTGQVEIVGRSRNGFETLEALRSVRPDVWFLDIEMPEMNGLELAERIAGEQPGASIVFVTAYDHYALAAFEQAAIDYILKPIELDRLNKTISRLQAWAERKPAGDGQEMTDEPGKLTVRLFGAFHAAAGEGKNLAWRTSKEKELFAYLLLQAKGPVFRDRIIEELWPDETYEKAKIYLHTCISLLRKHLRQLGFENIVRYEKEHYFLHSDRIELDVHQYGEQMSLWKETAEAPASDLESTLALYTGPLLADEDYPWTNQLRLQLEQSAVESYLWLGAAYMASGHPGRAIEMAEQAIQRSPYDEEAYRLLMEAYRLLGKHDQVLRVYLLLTKRLEELHIQPSDLTRKLYEAILER